MSQGPLGFNRLVFFLIVNISNYALGLCPGNHTQVLIHLSGTQFTHSRPCFGESGLFVKWRGWQTLTGGTSIDEGLIA